MDLFIVLITIISFFLFKIYLVDSSTEEISYEEVKSNKSDVVCSIGSNMYNRKVDRAYHYFVDYFRL